MAANKPFKRPKFTNYCFTELNRPIALVHKSSGNHWIASEDVTIASNEGASRIPQRNLLFTGKTDDEATDNHEAIVQPKFVSRDPLTCEICNQSCGDATTLKEHMQSHGEGQNLTCASCHHPFTKLQCLMDHWNKTTKGRKCYASLEVKTQISKVDIIQKRVNKVTKRKKKS